MDKADSFAGNNWHNLAQDWIGWADRLAPQAEKINIHLIEALDLPGLHARRVALAGVGTSTGAGAGANAHIHDHSLCVLDLASGAGEPAFGIARRLAGDDMAGPDANTSEPPLSPLSSLSPGGNITGPTGRVIASDIVPAMCAGLAGRAAVDGIGNLSVMAADMENLPVQSASMDAVSCRFGVMFCAHPDAALAEALRVLRPGGRAAFMLWGAMADNPLFAAMDGVLRDHTGTGFGRESETDAANGTSRENGAGFDPFAFANRDQACARMMRAGFRDVRIATHTPVGRIPAHVAFWKPQMEMLFGQTLRRVDDTTRQNIDQAMQARLAALITDGVFRVPMCFHVLAGQRG